MEKEGQYQGKSAGYKYGINENRVKRYGFHDEKSNN